MSANSNTPPENYFNDLSQPTGANNNKRQRSPKDDGDESGGPEQRQENTVPKTKRIACVICRKRKLKCDGTKPSCSTCTRLNHNCAYDEVRKKSGPKRGYVKALEERLKHVESQLKTTNDTSPVVPPSATSYVIDSGLQNQNNTFDLPSVGLNIDREQDAWNFNSTSPQPPLDMNFDSSLDMNLDMGSAGFTWEVIGLGLEEPLPPQDTIDELHEIYFDKIHPTIPMIHKYRYLAAMNLAPNMRPPVALRYAIWTLAASVTEKYMDLKEHFYRRSRKYIEMDEMKGHGESMISIAYSQTHTLLASYEFKMMYFPRAWMSTGKGVRLAQMMGLHRIDRQGLDVKQCIPPPRDWTEAEERRRTFWMAFCEDRYASIGTGWPMTIEEKDILTDLPSSENAFEMSKQEPSQTLQEAMSPMGAGKLSAFGSVCLMASLFGRNLIHLHRPDNDDRDHDLDGEFWKRHRHMDNILLSTSLSMPSHLKLPNGLQSPNIVFTNFNIHTSTICLHQAAIYKADKHRMPATVSAESKTRCITAASEIASIMRMISHMDLAGMNPFVSFCLYVAARVFVQFLKSRPNDYQAEASLQFLLSAMHALKKKNPLTESFLVQLDVDLEMLGNKKAKYRLRQSGIIQHTTLVDENSPVYGAGAYVPNTDVETFSTRPVASAHPPKIGAGCNYATMQSSASDSPPTLTPSGPSMTRGAANSSPNMDWLHNTSIPTRRNEHPAVAMQGILQSGPNSIFENTNPNPPSNQMGNYGQSESSSGETGLSPDNTDGPSNRQTPNSSTDSRHSTNSQPDSRHSPYTTSPAGNPLELNKSTASTNSPQNFFQAEQFDRNRTGLTPGATGMSPNSFDISGLNAASWDGTTGTGMTPVAEGMLRNLMDPGFMEMGWENGG